MQACILLHARAAAVYGGHPSKVPFLRGPPAAGAHLALLAVDVTPCVLHRTHCIHVAVAQHRPMLSRLSPGAGVIGAGQQRRHKPGSPAAISAAGYSDRPVSRYARHCHSHQQPPYLRCADSLFMHVDAYTVPPISSSPGGTALQLAIAATTRLCLNCFKHCVISLPVDAGLLFDWLHPAHFATIVAALEAWADVPEVRSGSVPHCVGSITPSKGYLEFSRKVATRL